MKGLPTPELSTRLARTMRVGIAALLVVVSLGILYAATPSFFAAVNEPIGVAATPGRVLVTRPFCGDPRQVLAVDPNGNVSVFVTLPPRGGDCFEDYIAVSPGLGGFPANHVYVTQGANILKIDPFGSSVTTFTTIFSLPASHNGITFDRVGSFNFDMIVTGSNGEVWRVDFLGNATLVGTVPELIEGPDVAPLGFGPLGGQVFVAAEGSGTVYAVSAGGVVTSVVNWPGAEGVNFIPSQPCNAGASGGAFFTSIFPTHITSFPASDFAGLGGKALVMSEFGAGIGLLDFVAGSYSISTFQTDIGQHEGSSFVDCTLNQCPLTQGFWKNHPDAWPVSSLTLGSQTYTQQELLILLKTPVRGDASLILAHQLIAAKLNVANGSDPAPITTVVNQADSLLSQFGGKLPYQVKPSSTNGQAMVSAAKTLDDYNNGLLTPSCFP